MSLQELYSSKSEVHNYQPWGFKLQKKKIFGKVEINSFLRLREGNGLQGRGSIPNSFLETKNHKNITNRVLIKWTIPPPRPHHGHECYHFLSCERVRELVECLMCYKYWNIGFMKKSNKRWAVLEVPIFLAWLKYLLSQTFSHIGRNFEFPAAKSAFVKSKSFVRKRAKINFEPYWKVFLNITTN